VSDPVEIVKRKADLNDVRELCERVAEGFKNVASTLVPAGEPRDTAAQLFILGKDLQRFGEAFDEFWKLGP
jgi:hypothetical protein